MEPLLKKLLQTLSPVEITFEQDLIVTSTNYDTPQSRNDISDITFTNMSQSGIVYIKSVPLQPGQSKTYVCNWNEINKSNFEIRFETGASEPLCVVDFKVIKPRTK